MIKAVSQANTKKATREEILASSEAQSSMDWNVSGIKVSLSTELLPQSLCEH